MGGIPPFAPQVAEFHVSPGWFGFPPLCCLSSSPPPLLCEEFSTARRRCLKHICFYIFISIFCLTFFLHPLIPTPFFGLDIRFGSEPVWLPVAAASLSASPLPLTCMDFVELTILCCPRIRFSSGVIFPFEYISLGSVPPAS